MNAVFRTLCLKSHSKEKNETIERMNQNWASQTYTFRRLGRLFWRAAITHFNFSSRFYWVRNISFLSFS